MRLAPRHRRIDELTAVRGVAALMVVLYHARTSWHPIFASGERFTMVVATGWIWVHFFFVLSGFVMMEAYGGDFAARLRVRAYVRFIVTRFGRIYPLHLAALGAIALFSAVGWIGVVDPPGSLVASLLLTQGFTYVPFVWNGVAWSISTEWYVYLAFPFVVPLLCRLPKRAAIVLAVGVAALVAHAYLPADGGADWPPGRLVICFLEFVLGCVVHRMIEIDAWPRIGSRPIATAIGLLPVGLMLLPAPFSGPVLNAAIAVGFAITVGILASEDTLLGGVLNSRALQFLGVVSYSVYLTHEILFSLFDASIDRAAGRAHVVHDLSPAAALALFPAFVAVLVLVSWGTWRTIEEPLRKAAKRLAMRIDPPRAAAEDRSRIAPAVPRVGA